MANDNYWRQRIPVIIRNNMQRELLGDPLEVQVGNRKGQVPLVGALAEGIRVTTSYGDELIFSVSDPNGKLIEKGPIPENSIIVFPVECHADTLTTNYIYFNNPSAWAIGDFFKTHREIYNEGFEKETSYGPLNWELDLPDDNRFVEWSKGEAHNGNRSIKIGAKSEKQSAPFGATQQYLHLLSGVSYILEGWIKAENVKGDPRLAVIFGNLNSEDFKLVYEKLSGGTGTYDWKKVTAEFTVPNNVSGAHIQTLLEGTGTVWFDDIRLTCKQDYDITATVLKQEKLSLKEIGKTDKWYDDNPNDKYSWQSRAAIRTLNFSGQECWKTCLY